MKLMIEITREELLLGPISVDLRKPIEALLFSSSQLICRNLKFAWP